MNPQAAYDNDSGTNPAQERAQEWVSEHICDVCEAHPGCEHACTDDGDLYCRLDGAFVDGMEPSACIHYDDEVAKRMEAAS
jgi:hypothetical protein